MKKRIIGIDTGTNSLGWAVVDKLDNGQYELVKKGSLIFQEGVKIEKGIESSKASERTGHRALRKQYFRRRLRKIEVLKVLIKYQLCPYLSDEQLHEWHVHKRYPMSDAFIEWQRTNENEQKNPYYYRYRALTQVLDLNSASDRFVLGRALYHLSQRRGFISNRLDSNENNEENGKVQKGISDLSKEIAESGCTYLGEYFYKLYQELGNKVRLRSRYTDREEHYIKEFDAICVQQQLGADLVKDLERALYFQRPLKSQKQGVGHCTFEPLRPRCAESHPAYEEFRMWSTINNIKVQGPTDEHLRHLRKEEIQKILPKFFRKSKPDFDFEDIAKELAGKNNYQYIKDESNKPYKFNYRMSQSISGCPTCAALREIWGDDFASSIAETYTNMQTRNGNMKTPEYAVDDVWNALLFMETKEKLEQFGINKLQLSGEQAKKFSNIRLSHAYSSISLCAIRKILPYLKRGLKYSNAVFMANVPTIVGKEIWQDDHDYIEQNLFAIIKSYEPGCGITLEDMLKDFLSNSYDLAPGAINKMYHPSMIDVYPDAKQTNGIYQLGSPRTNAIKNPMAMRSLHQLRKVINTLLKERVINQNTEVHIEYARELNDANKRAAIASWNKDREKKRKTYSEEIKKLYKAETHKDIEPTETDILKFELWEEQKHLCLYTGKTIGISDFLGPNLKFDIEHTIPRSAGGDSQMENMTLCDMTYNRQVKIGKLPSQLSNHDEIMTRLVQWQKKVYALTKDIDGIRTHSGMEKGVKDRLIQKRHKLKLERDYWRGKVQRFEMTEVPEGFSLRQGIGIGLISKYAGLYLKSLFHKQNDRSQTTVRVIKGLATSEFRKMWGIQDVYAKKCRDNHIHHCIDAIVIACIDPYSYNRLAHYYQALDNAKFGVGDKPVVVKPWPTFSEDMKALYDSVLVSHDTPDNMPKHTKRREVKTPTGVYSAQGDTARASLHNDTYYGAIERDGEIKYVVRKPLSSLKETDVENIVDDIVRQKVKDAIKVKGFKEAMSGDIFMNEEVGIKIKKVRCFCPAVANPLNIRQHRDISRKEYKQQYHVTTDSNYCMAIYEGVVKGKFKRSFEIVTMLDAASYYKKSADVSKYYPITPEEKNGLKLRCKITAGTQIILKQAEEEELDISDVNEIANRLYFVAIMSKDGRIVLRHSHEAREASLLVKEQSSTPYKIGEGYRPQIRMSLSNFHALIEGVDFVMNPLGEIKLIHHD